MKGRIVTCPANAVEASDEFHGDSPARLWMGLLRSLKRKGIAASLPKRWQSRPKKCNRCGKQFHVARGLPGHRYCSDECAGYAEERRRLRQRMSRSESRAEARQGRRCARRVCGEPIIAERSTKRYCSDLCRYAAHRDATAH